MDCQTILKKIVRRPTLSNFKIFSKTTVIKIASYRHTDKWDKIESPEINLHVSGWLVFVKGAKVI